MKLEDQVVSLELATRLKALGVKQKSLFVYVPNHKGHGIISNWTIERNDGGWSNQCISAFTVAELGELLPMHHNYGAPQSGKCNGGDEYDASYVHWGNLWHDRAEYERYQLPPFVANIEADARAKMLIYLIENNLITV